MSGVSKRFGHQLVLADVDLVIERGQIHGLAGHNGSGKSTLVKALSGYYSPEPGAHIRIGSTAGPWEASHDIRSAHLRVLHQDLGLFEDLSVVENFAFAAGFARRALVSIDWRAQESATTAALRSLGVELDVQQKVRALTAVERTMLAVARAVSGLPDHGILILDEPTATLTAHEAVPLFAMIRRLTDRGAGVLLVTHHLDEFVEMADVVTVLKEGRVELHSPMSSLTRKALADAVTGTPAAAHQAPSSRRTYESSQPVLQVVDLAGGRLRPLSLDIRPGEIVGVGGLTGSGRDDVAPLVTGQSAPDGGVVRVNGVVLERSNRLASVRAGVAYAPADRKARALFPNHTAGENVTLPMLRRFSRRLRVNRRAEHKAASSALESCELTPMEPQRQISTFSGGNQQKTVIARCLTAGPTVLVLDEPTQGVDVGARAAIYRLIRDAASRGIGVLVGSSDDDELAELCDRALVLVHGEVFLEAHGAALTAHHLSQASLGELSTSGRS
ncbi:sugar ABC transporter ATP-binding protein [Marmoricola sp. URHA0025 HA25]